MANRGHPRPDSEVLTKPPKVICAKADNKAETDKYLYQDLILRFTLDGLIITIHYGATANSESNF